MLLSVHVCLFVCLCVCVVCVCVYVCRYIWLGMHVCVREPGDP